MTTPGHDQFWAHAEPLLTRADVARSTMMGFPCLRRSGKYFASIHRTGEAMIVKLPAARVQDAIAAGEGEAFAPNGRVFKEWLAIPTAQADTWPALLEEAYAFAA